MAYRYPQFRNLYTLSEKIPCVIYYQSGGGKPIWEYGCNECERLFFFPGDEGLWNK